ncbi:hypothetical protein FSO04_42335, partial [Paraburkholderia madseniana]
SASDTVPRSSILRRIHRSDTLCGLLFSSHQDTRSHTKCLTRSKQRMGVNYGLNRVRFTSPVLVGSQLRARFAVESVTDVDNGGVQVEWNVTLERLGSERPVCVAEFITRHYF